MTRSWPARHVARSGSASFAVYLIASASCGFAAGSLLAAGLLVADCIGLRGLMAATDHSLAMVAIFTLGLGALCSPLSLATGLALGPPRQRAAGAAWTARGGAE